MMINIEKLRVGPMSANAYVVYGTSKEAVLIDPGGDATKILKLIEELGLSLKLILLTHGHFDHTMATEELRVNTGAKVYIHLEDYPALQDDEYNLSSLFYRSLPKVTEAETIVDGQILKTTDFEIRVLHTPGHSPGSLCFLIENELFSGDTIFKGFVGRTDLIGGDKELLMESLKKLAVLDPGLRVWPGHQSETTLEQERMTNPWLIQALMSL